MPYNHINLSYLEKSNKFIDRVYFQVILLNVLIFMFNRMNYDVSSNIGTLGFQQLSSDLELMIKNGKVRKDNLDKEEATYKTLFPVRKPDNIQTILLISSNYQSYPLSIEDYVLPKNNTPFIYLKLPNFTAPLGRTTIEGARLLPTWKENNG